MCPSCSLPTSNHLTQFILFWTTISVSVTILHLLNPFKHLLASHMIYECKKRFKCIDCKMICSLVRWCNLEHNLRKNIDTLKASIFLVLCARGNLEKSCFFERKKLAFHGTFDIRTCLILFVARYLGYANHSWQNFAKRFNFQKRKKNSYDIHIHIAQVKIRGKPKRRI